MNFRIASTVVAALGIAAAANAETKQMPTFSVDVQGSGKPVILIPGLSCTAEVWNETVAHLNAEGFQTEALTIKGFGGTPPVAREHLLQSVRDDLAAYIKQEHMEHPVIIGHSLGGTLALWIAASYPDLPGKVVSVDGLPFLAGTMNPGATSESAAKMGEGIRKAMVSGPPAVFAAMTRQSDESMITSPANVEREFKVNSASDRNTVGQAMAELFATDLRPELSKIKVPVLLIGSWIGYKQYGATHDRTLALYKQQVSGIPNVTVIMSDEAKHFVQLDTPDWFYAQVDSFLKSK